MPTEPYPQMLIEKERTFLFKWVAFHNAICVLRKADGVSEEGRILLLEKFRKHISYNE